MSIPHVFTAIKSSDFTLRTIVANKRFYLNSGSVQTTGSGYFLHQALYSGVKVPIGTQAAANDPTNSIDQSYQSVIWKQIDAQYYRFPYDRTATLEHFNERYTFKFLNLTASVLSLPYLDFGESIKPGSVEITSSNSGNFRDDGNGNLYDVSIDTGSYSNRYNLTAYWGFNDEFRKFKRGYGTLEKSQIQFKSRTFTPDQPSIGKNIGIEPGVQINGLNSGQCATFNQSVIYTQDRPEFNFASNEDFTISFWINTPSSNQNFYPTGKSSGSNVILSKRGAIYEQVSGITNNTNTNGLEFQINQISSSTSDKPTDVYPYHFEIFNADSDIEGQLVFKRSDGINTISLISSDTINIGWHHVAATKSGSLLSLYVNSDLQDSAIDTTLHPINKNLILFGSDRLDLNSNESKWFTGNLDEIRFYDVALSPETIATLRANSDQSLYQTAVVGNVFYRSGKIVVSGLNPFYNDTFNGSWTMKYRGTHRIYQYEALVRIPAGSYNLTLNPTARVNPASDLLIDEMTGSFSNTSLSPFISEVGLFNSNRELMVVGKLSQPLRTRNDVDINLILRFDA